MVDIKESIDLVNLATGVAVNVPVWALLIWFLNRWVVRREIFEGAVKDALLDVSRQFEGLRLSDALVKKDVEFAKVVEVSLGRLSKEVTKQQTDLNVYYERLKTWGEQKKIDDEKTERWRENTTTELREIRET